MDIDTLTRRKDALWGGSVGAVTKHSIRVYTALSELRGDNEDVLDALIPFFEPVLELLDGKIFNPKLLSAGVKRLYRWQFTTDIAERFIPRLVKKGYLKREGSKTEAIYIVNFKMGDNLSGPSDISTKLKEIVGEFKKFIFEMSTIMSYKRTDDELTDVLIRFLVSSDAFGASHSGIISAADLSQIGADASLINQLDEGGRPLSADDRFVTARFVRGLIDANSKYLEDLTKLASIGLLTEVADEFLKPTAIARKSDLTIVLDTAIVFDYIGLSGKELKENAVLILDSLRSIGCKLVVFNTTCSEMQRTLQSMLRLQPPSRHGQTHQAMIRQEILPDYVNGVARNPEKAVEVAGITISQIEISNFPSLHRHFDEDRRTDFYSDVFWVQDRARDHDADCMTLLMRLRQGKRSSDIFDCGYIFVTRNPSFARKARSYCLQSRLINDWQEGPVVHLSELATVAWLRTGFGGAEAIPRTYLVASCERVLRLRPEVSEAVAAKLKSLTPEIVQQYEALLLDSRSVMRLADETMNDESIVTDENAMRLFDVMKRSIVEEEVERHKLNVEEMSALHAAELASARELQQRESDRQRAEFEERVTALEESNKLRAAEADRARLEQERSALAAEQSRAELEKRFTLEVKSREANQNSIVNGVLLRINRRNKIIEVCIYLFLASWVVVAIFDQITDYLHDDKYWKTAIYLVAVFGVYRSLMAAINKPTVGLTSILNLTSKRRLSRELKGLHIDWIDVHDFKIKDGRVKLLEKLDRK